MLRRRVRDESSASRSYLAAAHRDEAVIQHASQARAEAHAEAKHLDRVGARLHSRKRELADAKEALENIRMKHESALERVRMQKMRAHDMKERALRLLREAKRMDHRASQLYNTKSHAGEGAQVSVRAGHLKERAQVWVVYHSRLSCLDRICFTAVKSKGGKAAFEHDGM